MPELAAASRTDDHTEFVGRSARKRKAILDAARAVFLSRGYLGASMDEIAALAGVSKQTVYKQFADKERLFTEIVLGTIDRVGEPFFDEMQTLRDSDDPAKHLGELARRLMTIVMQPEVLRLRRLVTAEAPRFPELGRTYAQRGPGRTVDALTAGFQNLAARGLLSLDDAVMAARHFLWLVVSIPLNEAMLHGDDEHFTKAELERFADAGARAFLAAYGNSSSASARPAGTADASRGRRRQSARARETAVSSPGRRTPGAQS